ncbi:MAG: hypothetical protein VX346_22360 [Planctomycetota bacterium]|nr:hypothetical protein [Planctomycetota bacterium]
MQNTLWICALAVTALAQPAAVLAGDTDRPVDELMAQAIKTVGGEEKLLDVFRFRERVLITSTPAPPVAGGERGNRTSVVKVGGGWWIGTTKRNKDKVRVLCWAWSLRILLDDKSKVEAIPDIVVAKKSAFGLRVTGSVKEPVDLFFDRESNRLTAIDYTDTRHILGEWKKTKEGHNYPSHVAGFRFADRKLGTIQKNQWYQTDILELTPLKELPSELEL